jgi:hypothetical protein
LNPRVLLAVARRMAKDGWATPEVREVARLIVVALEKKAQVSA